MPRKARASVQRLVSRAHRASARVHLERGVQQLMSQNAQDCVSLRSPLRLVWRGGECDANVWTLRVVHCHTAGQVVLPWEGRRAQGYLLDPPADRAEEETIVQFCQVVVYNFLGGPVRVRTLLRLV